MIKTKEYEFKLTKERNNFFNKLSNKGYKNWQIRRLFYIKLLFDDLIKFEKEYITSHKGTIEEIRETRNSIINLLKEDYKGMNRSLKIRGVILNENKGINR